MATYRDWILDLLPAWLRRRWGAAWFGALGDALDELVTYTRAAAKADLPKSAPADALGEIGADRALERYPGESAATYRARLAAAWTTWSFAGTEAGLVAQYAAAGLPKVVVVEAVDWTPEPPDHNPDWSRFWIIFPAGGHPWDAEKTWGNGTWGEADEWGPGTWDDGTAWGAAGTWGTTASQGAVTLVRRIAKKWKPAHTTLVNITIVISGEVWGPFGTWDSGTWGGETRTWGAG